MDDENEQKMAKEPSAEAPSADASAAEAPFWRRKSLEAMTREEWESLCDGCGKCCLVRLEDENTGDIFLTDASCWLLDRDTCRCGDYVSRHDKVPDCIRLTPDVVRQTRWLPHTCAYRLVAEGRDLFDWHPLKSGRRESVAEAGMSVRGKTVCETTVPDHHWERRRKKWPGEPRILRGVTRSKRG